MNAAMTAGSAWRTTPSDLTLGVDLGGTKMAMAHIDAPRSTPR